MSSPIYSNGWEIHKPLNNMANIPFTALFECVVAKTSGERGV